MLAPCPTLSGRQRYKKKGRGERPRPTERKNRKENGREIKRALSPKPQAALIGNPFSLARWRPRTMYGSMTKLCSARVEIDSDRFEQERLDKATILRYED